METVGMSLKRENGKEMSPKGLLQSNVNVNIHYLLRENYLLQQIIHCVHLPQQPKKCVYVMYVARKAERSFTY